RTKNPSLALEDKFNQVADNEKNQQRQKDNVHIDQQKESDIVAQGVFRRRLGHSDFKKRKRQYHQGSGKDHQTLTLATLGFFQFEVYLDRLSGARIFHERLSKGGKRQSNFTV